MDFITSASSQTNRRDFDYQSQEVLSQSVDLQKKRKDIWKKCKADSNVYSDLSKSLKAFRKSSKVERPDIERFNENLNDFKQDLSRKGIPSSLKR